MQLKRVVVTGIGALTPIGNNADEYWQGLSKGVSGAAPITRFDADKFKTKFACEIKDYILLFEENKYYPQIGDVNICQALLTTNNGTPWILPTHCNSKIYCSGYHLHQLHS